MPSRLKILLIEDIPEDAGLIERALRKEGFHFQTLRVDTKDEFITEINQFKPDVILSDHSLPQFNSQEALKICKKIDPDIPFILVTGAVSEEFAVKVLKQGADDYILKSNLSRLGSAISQALKQRKLKVKKMKAEETLRQQNLELKRLNKELDKFVYSASHDLRSPLTSLLGLINVAFTDINTPGTIETYLHKMHYTVNKLDNILKEILAYSYNARLSVKSEKIDIESLINECFEKWKHLEDYSEIEKKVSIHQEVELYSDRYRLALILNNLISNAILYRDVEKQQSIIHIDITVSKIISITIKDNGIGIHRNYLPKVFDMFYRGSSKSVGAGLGLYIAKEAVEKLDGKITLESFSGRGTKFTITIPNHLSEQKEETY